MRIQSRHMNIQLNNILAQPISSLAVHINIQPVELELL